MKRKSLLLKKPLTTLLAMAAMFLFSFQANAACEDIEDYEFTNGNESVALVNGGEYVLDELPSHFYLQTNLTGNAGSVRYTVTDSEGDETTVIENYSPYTYPAGGSDWNLGAGTFEVEIKVYKWRWGWGYLCDSDVISFTLTENNCDAFAGTMTADQSSYCLNGPTTIMASADGNAVIPEGYSQAYVLTQGESLTILNYAFEPSFVVTEGGMYTIHSLVFDETLDLSIVEPGVTTGFDVFGLLIDGGGEVCASLDVAGAPINVDAPNAGGLTADMNPVSLENGSATISATPDGNIVVPTDYEVVYVLTQGESLTIVNAGPVPSFEVSEAGNYTIHTLVYDDATLDLSIVEIGVTTGFDVFGLIVPGGGDICASLDVAGAPITVEEEEVCTAFAGTMTADQSSYCLNGPTTIMASADGNAVIPEGYSQAYVLTQGESLTILNYAFEPSFVVTEGGMYTIHSLVFDETLDLSIVEPGVTTGFDVFGLLIDGGGEVCASLDVAGAPINVDAPNAGGLTADMNPVSLENGSATISATPDGNIVVPTDYEVVYVLTQGESLTIVNAGPVPSFEVSEAGDYTIHTLVYDDATLDLSIVEIGVTTGFDVFGLIVPGGGDICASLDVAGAPITVEEEVCTAFAGTMTADQSSYCLNGPTTIMASADGNAVIPEGYSQAYVLTQGESLTILNYAFEPSFVVTEGGMYTIHSLVFDETLDLSIVEPGVTTGFDVFGLLIDGGGEVCASLDVAGAPINVDAPNAGGLTADMNPVSLENGSATISATPDGNIVVPTDYEVVYVLTQGESLTIVNAGPVPSFEVSEAGDYTIHTLVYDDATLDLSIVEIGVTTGFDVFGLIVPGGGDICASLDVAGAPITVEEEEVCTAFAGTMTADQSSYCLNGPTTIMASADGNAVIPEGYSQAYVLTQGESLTILNYAFEPSFVVTEGGMYTIHSLVFDETLDLSIVEPGVTTGFDVFGLLIDGGGEVCASLDVAGAPINVDAPNAGGLTADMNPVSLENGSATISATPDGNIVVPTDYEVVYVLTQGESLTIVNAGPVPSFEVSEAGDYTIHTLVYDDATLDLSIVEIGVTTGFDVFGLIVPGGGDICASLDVAGAPITVEEEEVCTAFAGTMTADQSSYCLNGPTTIMASADGNAVIPEGYSQAYVLTQGESLTILNYAFEPSFVVTEGGMYTIHSLVFDETLDLSIVEPGVTTGFDVFGLLIDGGGEVCASLDVAGAPINVDAPNAGGLTADMNPVSLENGSATISATPDGNIVVPTDYEVVYVLTQGESLTIVNAGPVPSFEVSEAGDYTIHTLVYDDATLDLSIVEIGVTTGFDVFGLIVPGGGDICASLDVAGAPITVEEEEGCAAYAGTLYSQYPINCLSGGEATIMASEGEAPVIPDNYQQIYVLTEAFTLTIIDASGEPEFTVSNAGFYRIHSLVYDPATLDLSIVDFGNTTGFDVNSLLIQGGGDICASLDVHGALNLVLPSWFCFWFNGGNYHKLDETAMLEDYISKYGSYADFEKNEIINSLRTDIYPNPASDKLTLEMEMIDEEVLNYTVIDQSGREIQSAVINYYNGGIMTLDVSNYAKGSYIIRFNSDYRTFVKKFQVIK